MIETLLSDKKTQFSGHETFPLRQLWLKKAYSEVKKNSVPNSKENKSIFSDDSSVVRFGVGKNMVSAIRHWALATGIIEGDDKTGYKITNLGEILFGKNGLDIYQEHISTAWLIHWKLAGEGRRSTTWYWLFNYVIEQSFDTEHLLENLDSFTKENNLKVSNVSLKRDIECCLRSYVPRVAGESPEEISDSVLGELSILQQTARSQFEFRRGPKQSLHDSLFAYCLMCFWERFSPDTKTISFESIAHEYGSPGRVFKLDESSIADRLQSLEDLTGGSLIWSDTAGIKQIFRQNLKINKDKFLELAYD